MPTGDNVGDLIRPYACGAHAEVDCVVGESPGVFVPVQAFLFYGGLQLAVNYDGSRAIVKEIYAQNRPQRTTSEPGWENRLRYAGLCAKSLPVDDTTLLGRAGNRPRYGMEVGRTG